jgi:hypothetical protein
MTDEQMQSLLEEGFDAMDTTPEDVERSTRQVMERKAGVHQRSRWWPFPVFYRRTETPTDSNTTEYQRNPIPATNGHTPTVIGRTTTMFTPVKAVTAGAIVFALGAFLIAQPFEQDGMAPGAEAEPVEATWITGESFWAPSCTGPESVEIIAGVQQERGYLCESTRYEASDPRFTAEGSWRWSADTHDTEEGRRVVIHGADYLTNEGGGWTCPVYDLASTSGSIPNAYSTGGIQLCVGTGGYEGLSALLVWPEANTSTNPFMGLIFSGDVPPLPDPPAAE